jgi:hypothetical protein
VRLVGSVGIEQVAAVTDRSTFFDRESHVLMNDKTALRVRDDRVLVSRSADRRRRKAVGNPTCLAVALHSALINQLVKPTAECAARGSVLELSLELRYADALGVVAERVENSLVIVTERPI